MNDPNNIQLWKLKNSSNVLAQVLKCIPGVKSQKVVHQALDGSIYIQQVGNGVRQLTLTLFVDSQDQLLEIDKANASGAFLNVYYKGTSYFGIIEDEMPEWEEQQPGNCYTAVVTFQVSNAIKDGIT